MPARGVSIGGEFRIISLHKKRFCTLKLFHNSGSDAFIFLIFSIWLTITIQKKIDKIPSKKEYDDVTNLFKEILVR